MADDTTNTDASEAPADDAAPDADAPLGEAGLKALKAERDRAAKLDRDYKAAQAELQKFKDANKSEHDKAVERATEAEKRAADSEARALRLEIAHEKGLTPAQARRLSGSTKEELEADADELIEMFGGATPPATGPRRPQEKGVPKPSQKDDAEPDGNAIAEQIYKIRRGQG